MKLLISLLLGFSLLGCENYVAVKTSAQPRTNVTGGTVGGDGVGSGYPGPTIPLYIAFGAMQSALWKCEYFCHAPPFARKSMRELRLFLEGIPRAPEEVLILDTDAPYLSEVPEANEFSILINPSFLYDSKGGISFELIISSLIYPLINYLYSGSSEELRWAMAETIIDHLTQKCTLVFSDEELDRIDDFIPELVGYRS